MVKSDKKSAAEYLNNIFEETKTRKGIYVQWFITVLIFLNIIAIIIDSFNGLNESINLFLHRFEVFSIAVFTIEYILRLISSPAKYKKQNWSYLLYVFSFMGIIDLLSILPFYFSFFFVLDLRFLRVFRLLRIFKLFRHFEALDTLTNVIKSEKNKLIMAFSILLILLVFASSSMYYIENHYQPNEFTNIVSTFWWAVATLTTIGYGDVYPVTAIGKFLAGLISILGIGIIALPSGIISAGLIKEATKKGKIKIIDEYNEFTSILETKIKDIERSKLGNFKHVRDEWFKSDNVSGVNKLDYASWSKHATENYATKNYENKKVFYAYVKLTDPKPYLQLLMCKVPDSYNMDNFKKENGLIPSNISMIERMSKIYSFKNNIGENRFCKIDLKTIPLDGNDNDEMNEIEEIIKVLDDFDNKIKEEPKIKNLKLLIVETLEDKEDKESKEDIEE